MPDDVAQLVVAELVREHRLDSAGRRRDTSVSKSTMRFAAPNPAKNALPCDERFEPSMT